MEDLLGACWQDQSVDLKGSDVVFCSGELEPRIFIKQVDGLVTMVKSIRSAIGAGAAPGKTTAWNIEASGDLSSEGEGGSSIRGKDAGSDNARERGSKA